MTTELVQLDDGRVFVKGTEPKPETERARYQPTPSRPTPGKKNLLRSIIHVPFARLVEQTPENLRFNFERLEKSGISWGRPDREKIYNFARHHWKSEGEAPQVDNIRYHFERLDDLEVTEELKIIETAEFFARTNFAWLLGQEREQDKHTAARAAAREAWDILDGRHEPWKGKSVAARFEGMTALLHEKGATLAAEVTKAPTKIPHVGVEDIFALLGPIPWVCEGLKMARGARPYMIGGYGYSGKTMVAQHMALCVAAGKPIFGEFSVERGRVLHLDYEQGGYLSKERYQRLARGMGIKPADLGDLLRLAVFPSTKLDDDEAEDILSATLDGFDFVLIDPYRAACPTIEENASTARVPLDMLARACGETCLPLVLHHAKKPSDKPGNQGAGKFSLRGSGAIFDALAGCFIFHGDDEKDGPIVVEHEKEGWRGQTIEDFGLRIMDVEGEGKSDWGVKVEYVDKRAMANLKEESRSKALDEGAEKVAAYMSNRDGHAFEGNREALVDAVGINNKVGLSAIRAMLAKGATTNRRQEPHADHVGRRGRRARGCP